MVGFEFRSDPIVSCPWASENIYLSPVKKQLLQYNLTRDLMLLYHSNKLKA